MANDNQIQLELIVDDKDVKDSFKAIQKDAEKLGQAIGKAGGGTNIGEQLELPNFNNKLALSTVRVSGVTEALQKMSQQGKVTSSVVSNLFTPDVLQSGFSFKSAIELLTSPLAKAAAGVAAVGFAYKQLQSEVLEGEALKKVEKQFETLAAQAGVTASTLREEFKKAANGLVDDSDILKAANKALIDLGDSAEKLPAVFTLARKATSLFGGDVVENFEKINSAIVSGQTRQLKSIGLFVDTQAAVEKYAKSLGVGAGAIDRTGQAQAVLNALLEKGNQSFKNINPDVDNATTASKRLKVAFNELGETISIITAKNFGGFVQSINSSITNLVNSSTGFLKRVFNAENATEAAESLARVRNEIAKMQKQAEDFGGVSRAPVGLQARIAEFKRQAEELEAFVKTKAEESQKAIDASTAQNKASGLTQAIKFNVDTSGLRKAGLEAEQAALATRLTTNKAYQQLATDLNESVKLQALKTEERTLIDKDYALKKEALEQKLANVTLAIQSQSKSLLSQLDSETKTQLELTDAQNAGRREQILQASAQKRIEIQATANASILAQQQGVNSELEALASQHASTIENIEATSAKKRAALVKQLAETSRTTVANGLSATIQDIGARLANGEGLFDNFGKSVVGIVADLAIQVGNILILQGLAIEAFIDSINTLLPGSGFAAAAAGVGLVLFGSALKALVGKGGSSQTASAGGGGGIGFNPATPTAQLPTIEDQKPTDPKTVVNLNIQGNVLDRRATGLELAEIIEETFSGQGLQVKGGFV